MQEFYELRDAALVAGVTLSAREVLLELARVPGEPQTTERLMTLFGCTRKTLGGWLSQLEFFGLIERETSGRRRSVRLRSFRACRAALVQRPGVIAAMQEKWPNDYPESMQEWLDRGRSRANKLNQVVDRANSETEVAKQRQTDKPAAQRMGYGQDPPPKKSKDDKAAELLKFMRDRIKTELESPVQPYGLKPLAQLSGLRKECGVDAVRTAIEYVTDPTVWPRLRKKYKLRVGVPTPGTLVAFHAIILPSALEWKQAQQARTEPEQDSGFPAPPKRVAPERDSSFFA